MIPDEAVEAAYSAPGSGAYVNKEDVRKMLEAAAPHIIAGHYLEINRKAIAHEIENPLTMKPPHV